MTINRDNCPVQPFRVSTEIAGESGKILGYFHLLTNDINPDKIIDIIPAFHRVDLRYKNFKEISIIDNKRYEKTVYFHNEILSFDYLAEKFDAIIENEELPIKIAHNDPKLSNILFDKGGKAITMIDLDTVMPGFLNSDFGDAIRSLTNTADENEKDLAKVDFNFSLFKSYTKAYLKVVRGIISTKEKEFLALFALLITFEQTIRFYGDYLQFDLYYKTDYSEHNLVRAKVQLKLLKEMAERYVEMQAYNENN